VFGRLSSKRRQVQIICPFCGFEQSEPSMAVSSFCRSCGEHFRIEKGTAMPTSGVRVSGVVPLREETADEDVPEPITAAESRRLSETLRQLDAATGQSDEKAPSEGLGQTLIQLSDPGAKGDEAGEVRSAEPILEEAASDKPQLGSEARPVETLRQGTVSAMFGGMMDRLSSVVGSATGFRPKMPATFVPDDPKKKGGPEKRQVRCFSCNHRQWVSVVASSTQCERCSVYISLADHDITTPSSHNIRTRGCVRVKRKGSLMGCDIACHDFEVDGQVSASVDCSGDAIFRHSARIMGSMHCSHLLVEKRCEVSFPQGVVTDSVDVHGAVLGNVICGGTIRIHKTGSIQGNATARAVDLKDGGLLTGKMFIQQHLVTELPEKKGYLKED
jgi:cytoskeletal protein CcmA (bactofilin family)